MKAYCITTFATEDTPRMTCCYPYEQWLDLKKDFEEKGIPFEAFVTEVDLNGEWYDE